MNLAKEIVNQRAMTTTVKLKIDCQIMCFKSTYNIIIYCVALCESIWIVKTSNIAKSCHHLLLISVFYYTSSFCCRFYQSGTYWHFLALNNALLAVWFWVLLSDLDYPMQIGPVHMQNQRIIFKAHVYIYMRILFSP